MAKTNFNPKDIKLTGILVVCTVAHGMHGSFSINLPMLKASTTGKKANVSYTLSVANLNGWLSNINGFLERIKSGKRGDMYLIDAAYLPELLARLEAANKEIAVVTSAYNANYEQNKLFVMDEVRDIHVRNRKKAAFNPKKINFPTREMIASAKIYISTIEMTNPSEYDQLSVAAQNIIDDAAKRQAIADHRSMVDTRCRPVLLNLAKMTKQFVGGKMHGGTINAYFDAVDMLRQANAVEFKPGFPEIDAFLKLHSYAVDLPEQYLDKLQNAWMGFYYLHGLIDLFPYEEFDISREDIETMFADDSEPIKSFVDLVQSLQQA